jgi:CelD/BcsL family acetyltransferase involved in cellulose biosynthesis
MKAHVCRPGELGPAELDLWRTFQVGAGLENPFLAPEFALAVDASLLSARVAVLEDGPEIVGFLPFSARPRHLARGIGWLEAGELANVEGFISSRPDLTLEQVLRAARIAAFDFSLLTANQRPASGHCDRLATPFIDLRSGFDEYVAAVKQTGGKFLKTHLQKRRSEQRRDPELRFEYGGRDPAMLGKLLEWKSAAMRQRGGVDLFALPGVREIVERLALSEAPGCAGSISWLGSGGRPMAVILGLRSATMLSGWFTSYDANEAARSPGTICLISLIEAIAESELRTFDLGPGEYAYKRHLATGVVDVFAGCAGIGILPRRVLRHARWLLARARTRSQMPQPIA